MESLEIYTWMQLFTRWIHIITGIAWIGASFYFVYLNNSLKSPEKPKDEGIDGELFAIHGGGFYQVSRYKIAPKELPKDLHWFKWEAYSTWITGFVLLILVYYTQEGFLTDPQVSNISHNLAVGIGIGSLVLGWFIYDTLQKSPLGKHNLYFGITIYSFIVFVSYVLSHFISGRAMYIHVGAIIGTIMVGNVLFNIIPGQKDLVKAMMSGQEPSEKIAKAAKNRSLHNNYFTLPVLLIMISNHYPITFSHKYNWAILAIISFLGAIVRHWFNLRGQGKKNYYIWPIAITGFSFLVFFVQFTNIRPDRSFQKETVPFSKVQEIISNRCISCHSANPTDDLFKIAPNGVKYDTPEEIKSKSTQIHNRVVVVRNMPFANKTGMTDEERELIGAWIEQGSNIKE